METAFVLQSWKYRWFGRPRFVLCHLRLVEISLANHWLRELILWVVPRPRVEISMTYTSQYKFINVAHFPYHLENNGGRLLVLPERKVSDGHLSSLYYLALNVFSEKTAEHASVVQAKA